MPAPPAARSLWLIGLAASALLTTGLPTASAGATPTCFGEPATIVVRDADSNVAGTGGPDVMVVTGRFPRVFGLAGDDLICTNGWVIAGPGDDRVVGFRRTHIVRELTLYGGPGDDRMYRRGPRDGDPHLEPIMRGGSGNDRLEGGTNMDEIRGGRGRDRLLGGGMWDVAWGGPGKDVLLGEARGDELRGGERADRLLGGAGRDTALGGMGADRCHAELEGSC